MHDRVNRSAMRPRLDARPPGSTDESPSDDVFTSIEEESIRVRLRRSSKTFVGTVFDKRKGPWRYALTSITMAWLLSGAFLVAATTLFGYHEEPDPADSLLGIVVLALIVAPLIENLFIVLIVECFAKFDRPSRNCIAVGTCGLLAAATHSEYNLSHGFSAAIIFGVMAFTYIDWKDLPFRRRFALTVAQHALCNLFTLVVFISSG